MEFSIFFKMGVVATTFLKLDPRPTQKYTIYHTRNFDIEFGQNRLKRLNFFRFWFFWEFSQSCLPQANFDLSSWIFVLKCTNTEWFLILNFVRLVGRDLSILDEFHFFNFFYGDIKFLKSMYPRSFLCDGTKIKLNFLKERTLGNWRESNMIHMLFILCSFQVL